MEVLNRTHVDKVLAISTKNEDKAAAAARVATRVAIRGGFGLLAGIWLVGKSAVGICKGTGTEVVETKVQTRKPQA